jgi:hypothetical protein
MKAEKMLTYLVIVLELGKRLNLIQRDKIRVLYDILGQIHLSTPPPQGEGGGCEGEAWGGR